MKFTEMFDINNRRPRFEFYGKDSNQFVFVGKTPVVCWDAKFGDDSKSFTGETNCYFTIKVSSVYDDEEKVRHTTEDVCLTYAEALISTDRESGSSKVVYEDKLVTKRFMSQDDEEFDMVKDTICDLHPVQKSRFTELVKSYEKFLTMFSCLIKEKIERGESFERISEEVGIKNYYLPLKNANVTFSSKRAISEEVPRLRNPKADEHRAEAAKYRAEAAKYRAEAERLRKAREKREKREKKKMHKKICKATLTTGQKCKYAIKKEDMKYDYCGVHKKFRKV